MSGNNFNQLVILKLTAHYVFPNAVSIVIFKGNLNIWLSWVCLIKKIFSDIFSVSGAPNRMEKGMKILGLTTLWPVAHYKLLVLFFSHSVFLLNNNNNYYSL